VSQRIHQFVDGERIYGADVSAPGADFGLAAMVGIGLSELSPGSGALAVWVQAKIGPVWFDVPLDFAMVSGTAAFDQSSGKGVRNIASGAIDNSYSATCKHLPVDEIRLAFKEIAVGGNATITAEAQGK
jgi:hypothetical protein